MIWKKIFRVLMVLVILFLQISFVVSMAELEGPENVNIIGEGIRIEKLITKDTHMTFYRLSFEGENPFVEINGNTFENMLSEGDAKHPSYLELNDEGGITSADFSVNENGGNYTFGEDTIKAPPYSRVFFDEETGIEIKVSENTDFTEFPDLLGYFSEGTAIRGNNITLPNGMRLVKAQVRIEENGFVLEEGSVDYEQMRISSKDVLIANFDADLSSYEGSWIKKTSSVLEMQSVEDGKVEVEFFEDHDILNTDFKDKLSVSVEDGDGLRFEEREDEGLIPSVVHKSSENGKTEIFNDKLEFAFEDDNIYVAPPLGLENEDFLEKYQSVAFEIESDSDNIDEKIRVNSYRQFAILDKNDDAIVSYNKYELPVSAKIEDNELQTLDQLREKYEGINFFIPDNSEFPEGFEEEDFPPYMIYYTDIFLESHPDAVENLQKIGYGNYLGSQHHGSGVLLGKIVDPYEIENHEIKTREIENPLYIFQHEYEHRLDYIISDEEIDAIERLDDPEIDKLFEKGGFDQEIFSEYYKKYPDRPSLQQCYNKIAIDAHNKLVEAKDLVYFSHIVGGDIYVSSLTGVPYWYSLINYNELDEEISSARYIELSATYREQPIELRKMRVQSSNALTSEIYTKLTQLAFDSGKMDVEEYKEIMGDDSCESSDCLDKLCVEYKLLCCEEYPSSPNC